MAEIKCESCSKEGTRLTADDVWLCDKHYAALQTEFAAQPSTEEVEAAVKVCEALADNLDFKILSKYNGRYTVELLKERVTAIRSVLSKLSIQSKEIEELRRGAIRTEADALNHRAAAGCIHPLNEGCPKCHCRTCGTPIVRTYEGLVLTWEEFQKIAPPLKET